MGKGSLKFYSMGPMGCGGGGEAGHYKFPMSISRVYAFSIFSYYFCNSASSFLESGYLPILLISIVISRK